MTIDQRVAFLQAILPRGWVAYHFLNGLEPAEVCFRKVG